MNPDHVTVLLITRNEAPNLPRTLRGLQWARRILVIDSFSTDETQALLRADPRVELIEREFKGFADQCNYGLSRITTPWVLSLDADYVCPEGFGDMIAALSPTEDTAGYRARFVYCIGDYPLRGNLYPPRTVLYRRERARYWQDGHAHKLELDGRVQDLPLAIRHDDRKPISHWFASQQRYAAQEADKLLAGAARTLGLADRCRRCYLGPLLMPIYCLFVKGLVFDGLPGLAYTWQRTTAEAMLAVELLDRRLKATHR